MTLILLVLGESMSGSFPKTSKLECIPNHTHKPRKLVPLDEMLKNVVDYNAGIIVSNDVLQNPK